MPYTVELLPPAARQVRRLPPAVQERILDRLAALEDNPRPHGSIMLTGQEGVLRVRVGDYLIVYRIVDSDRIVFIVRVAHRREVYRR